MRQDSASTPWCRVTGVSSSKRKENEAGSLDPSHRLLLQDCGGMLPRRDRRHGCETQDQENARRITHRQRHRPAARIWAQARGSAVDGAPSPQSRSDSVEVPCATPTGVESLSDFLKSWCLKSRCDHEQRSNLFVVPHWVSVVQRPQTSETLCASDLLARGRRQ